MDGDLNKMVQNILQNPEFQNLVKEIKRDTNEKPEINTDNIMAKLPEMMSMLGLKGSDESLQTVPEKSDVTKQSEVSEMEESLNNQAFPVGLTKLLKPGNKDKRNKLLCALKPYLSPARCSLIDKAMNAMQLSEVLGVMQSMPTSGNNDGKSG